MEMILARDQLFLIRRKSGNKRSLVEVGREIGIINESCMLNCLGKTNIGKARYPGILVDLHITISWVMN